MFYVLCSSFFYGPIVSDTNKCMYVCINWTCGNVPYFLQFNFLRATLCVSAVFAVARCPSILHLLWSIHKRIFFSAGFRQYPFNVNAKYMGRGGKILRFLTEITVYLGNGMRLAHGCYKTLIGSPMRSIEWWHLQRPSWTANPVSFEVQYQKKNGAS